MPISSVNSYISSPMYCPTATSKSSDKKSSKKMHRSDKSSGAQYYDALANQNIALCLSGKGRKNKLPQYNPNLTSAKSSGYYYYYLRNNPEEFYEKHGDEINKFLRAGYLEPIDEMNEDVPEKYKDLIASDIEAKKDYNRSIVDSVGIIDSLMTSTTTSPMMVYHVAPSSMINGKENKTIVDKGYFAGTLDEEDAKSDFSTKENLVCYKVFVPEGTPYLDLTDKEHHRMLFPRNMSFSVVENYDFKFLDDGFEVISA